NRKSHPNRTPHHYTLLQKGRLLGPREIGLLVRSAAADKTSVLVCRDRQRGRRVKPDSRRSKAGTPTHPPPSTRKAPQTDTSNPHSSLRTERYTPTSHRKRK